MLRILSVIFCLLLFALFGLSGCAKASAKIPVVMPDGSIQMMDANYERWGNQQLEDVYLESPSGLKFNIGKQGASNEATFKLGNYEITIGDANNE